MGAVPYATYARQLGLLAAEASSGRWERIADDVHEVLNGQVASKHGSLVPRQVRWDTGSFFTTGAVRESVERLLPPIGVQPDRRTYWDPTCGAGDLLLAAAQRPLATTPARTLTDWNRRLRGHDLKEPYVEAARMRLVLALLERHQHVGSDSPLAPDRVAGAFPLLQLGDGLQELQSRGASARFRGHILINPPYGMAEAAPSCGWSSGSTSQAATFTAAAAAALRGGGRLTAVLPDVLRSGSRYQAWRKELAGAHSGADQAARHVRRSHRCGRLPALRRTTPPGASGGSLLVAAAAGCHRADAEGSLRHPVGACCRQS